MNDDIYRYSIGTRVQLNGEVGTVIDAPWDTASGWTCKVEWDNKRITASGNTNERIAELKIVK